MRIIDFDFLNQKFIEQQMLENSLTNQKYGLIKENKEKSEKRALLIKEEY